MPHCGYLSAVSRMLEIYRALRERGVPVRIATHGGTYETVLRDAGVRYDIVGPRMSEQRCAEFLRAEIGMGDVRQSMYTDAELRTYAVAEAEYFRTHGIHVAVTGFTLTTLLSTRLAGIKLATEHAGSWVPPVYQRGLLPAPSLRRTRYLPASLARWLSNAAPPRVRFYCSGFNRVAAELGVPPVPSLAALVLGDLTLVPEVPEVLGIPAADLESWDPAGRPGYRPGTRLRYVGPIFARLHTPLPARVAEFLESGGPPLVYVAINSSPPELVRRAVRALAGLDARILVAATVHDLTDLAGPRVMVGGVLPSHLIMPRVDLAVTAGGQGSAQTAMAGGAPVLGIALQPEQDLNLALLHRRGAAHRVAPRAAGGPAFAALAGRMLADPAYRRAARRIQAIYDTVDGPGNAAEAIESLVVHSGGEAR